MKRGRGSTKNKSNKKKKHSKGDTANRSKCLDTGDLDKIKTELKDFNISDWREFGSKAGLKYETLKIIQENNAKVQDRFEECLAYWLRRKDNVDDKGKPSWRRLAEILEELGDKALADRIRDRKGVPSDVHKEEQVKNVTTPDRSTRLPRFLEDDYLQMTTEFANILKRFVFEVFKEREEKLKGVQVSLVSISPSNRKEIDEVDSETGLTAVLRNYCSLSKFQVLTTLAKDMKMTDITDELNQFEEKRKKLYKEILAKDFAKSAIKYCGTTGSREVTFKVKWSFKKATLEDFEDFLNHAFSSLDIYIHLSAVHNSLLTFVCVIPHWLVDEMKDYIIKNGDLFESKGAVEITVDGTIVFSVKHSLEPHQLSLENEEKETESLQSEEEAEEYMDQHYTQEDSGSGEGYACLMFHEKNSFIYFTAVPVKMLTALLEYIKDHHRFADIGPIHYFHFKWFNGFIELNFNEKPSAGWTVIPLIKPCRLYQEDIDSFDGTDESIPPYCFISFQGSPDAVPTLHYSVPLVGVADPIILFIHRTLKSNAPPVAPYTGLVYHEKKEEEHLIIFTAARLKDISNAVNCIENQYPLARINQLIGFDFDSNHDHIELILDAPQDQSITGWTIKPQSTKLLKDQVDRFSFTTNLPPSCLVSVYGSPDAVPTLHYSVPLVGVADPKTIDLLLKSSMTSLQVSYVGLIYYEWKGKEYLMTFTASKKLNHLFQYIEEYHPLAEIGQVYNFSFSPSSGFIELLFDDSCEGWTVQPLVEPCRLYQDDIDRFDEATYPLPPSCLVSVHGSPDAVPTLHYSVPLVGVAEPVTLCVDRKLQLEKDVLEVIASHKATFEKEKDRGIAESMKKLYESLKKQSILAKEKQELSERLLALIKEQELPKQQGPDDKEEQELKSELQETKAILDIYISKQQEQKAVEETLKTDIYLKDKTIADLVQEKSQLSKEMSQLLEEISELKTEKENDFTSKLKEINSNNEKILSRQEEIQTKSQDLMTILTDSDRIISELFVETEETEKDFDEQLQKDDRAEKQRQLQENISRALSVQQESMKEGSDLMQELSENNDLLENVIVSSKHLQKHTTYAGLIYYEEDGVKDLVTFTAAKKLNALLEFMKKEHPQAKLGPHVYFRIASPDGSVELDFNAPQDKPYTGWSIIPHMKPCRLYQRDIYNFGDKNYPLPPSCLVSVYASPDAVPTLHYSVPLVGVADPVTLFINVSQRTTPFMAVGAASAGSSSDETRSVRREGGFDIKTAKQKIKQVMIENHADFAALLQFSLVHVANKLFEVHMIPPEVQQSPTYDAISTCFVSMMSLLDSKSDLEKHCMTFLEALSSVGGPIEFAANLLREKWTTAMEGALQFEQPVKRVR